MRMIVTAQTATVYGKALVAGDEFDCPEKEAKLWAALARAKPADGTDLLGEGMGANGSRRSRRGSYNRRDMRAVS